MLDQPVARLGIALNPRQLACLRERSVALGVPQTRILAACIDVLDMHELEAILARYESVRRADHQSAKARADALKVP